MYALPPVPILGAVHARDLDLGSGKLLPTAAWPKGNMGAARGLSMSDRLVCRDTDDVTYHDGVLVVLRCVRRVCSV